MFSNRIQSVNFAAHTSEEVKLLAVKKITNPETYDQLLHPNYGGLYDPALGASDKDDICDTCGMNSFKCPGHMGYIELPLPVYHPLFFKLMLKVLKGSCFDCHRLACNFSRATLFTRQCDLLDKGFLTEASDLTELYHGFVLQATESSATDMNVQKLVSESINLYYNSVINNIDNEEKISCSKNIIRCKQDLVKEFIKVHLVPKTKECPYCKSVIRDVRSEFNSRLYFKAAAKSAIKKAISAKMGKSLQMPTSGKDQESLDETSLTNDSNAVDDNNLLDGDEEDQEMDSVDEEALKKKLCDQEYITPEEVKTHMVEMWNINRAILKCLFGSFSGPERNKRVTTPEIFFLDVIAVPPSRFRPQAFMGEKRFENPQTTNLTKVLWHCKLVEELLNKLKQSGDEEDDFVPVVLASSVGFKKRGESALTVPGKSYKDQLQNAWLELQTDVNMFMDCTLNKLVKDGTPGVRQLLEKKEGLFRKHMMGKRVNFACRSVISPDPYINTDEIGIPEVFARKLTYVQPVNAWNLSQLTQMVINGPKKYPGAAMIEFEDGRKKILTDDENERRAIAKQLLSSSVASEAAIDDDRMSQEKKVHRHLINGDVLLLNRQPTLHRPSIMAHKAKVLPKERTLRLHYANCKSYNADFDGDEMNAHFPQSELGRSEAYNLVSTNYNYLSPKDGKPLAGLIQDHIVSGVHMTSRGTFFDRDEYQQLIYSAFLDTPGRIKLVKPCILKPVPKWSGKQIISTVILNIIPDKKHLLNMNGNQAKIHDQSWPHKTKDRTLSINDPLLTEAQVIVREGQLLTGILDKTQYGAASFGLVHAMYELYGGAISGLLLSVFGRLFTTFLQHTGFTLGVEDILVLPKAEEKRVKIMEESRLCGDESALEALNMTDTDKDNLHERLQGAHLLNQGFELKLLDVAMKSRTDAINNKINSACMKGLLKKFPHNALQLMVTSGAKGSSVNCMQISCLLGQIELEGRRPPLTTSGRSLPSFLPYDTSPRSGGFVDGRFLTGIRPQEYFFHCMAGREGLVDTAVKTSSSGYLQRCLIKHMEALYVQYDMTVRDGDGSVVQFLYGDDGIDVLKHQYLNNKQFKSILQNYESYVSILKPSKVSAAVEIKKAPKIQRKCDRWKRAHGKPYSSRFGHKRKSPFLMYENDHRERIMKKFSNDTKTLGFSEADKKLMQRWTSSEGPSKENYTRKCAPCPDPVLSLFNPCCSFGAVSEKFHDEITTYVSTNVDEMLEVEENEEEEEDNMQKLRVPSEDFHPLMLIKYMRSLVEPGEAVGLLASQSIGEPSTQMTLNTFHFAGRGDMNVTLGIPRLREILMTASATIKTPQMDVLIQQGREQDAKILAKRMNKLNVMQILKHISVYESLKKSHLNKGFRCREFRVRLEFLPHYSYENNFDITDKEIMLYIEQKFIKKIPLAVTKIIRMKEKERLLQTNSKLNRTSSNKDNNDDADEDVTLAAPDEPDDLADLSDDDAVDGDAANMKERIRQTQFTSYDDPENEVVIDELEPPEDTINIYKDEILDSKETEDFKPLASVTMKESEEDFRVQKVLRSDRRVVSYLVDQGNQWCEFTLQFPLSGSKVMLVSVIEKLAEKSIIHESPGISRGMTTESKNPNENGRHRLKTEGINIRELWKYPGILDLQSIYTNNIHTMAKIYGIEAARRGLIKEVEDVFKVYGIHIDPRHLSLVGDYMTFEGTYKPFNRIGIESNPFPFQKMSFETSTNFLRQATAFGEPDDLGSPSSRIVVGRVIGTGTGMCDLLPKLSV